MHRRQPEGQVKRWSNRVKDMTRTEKRSINKFTDLFISNKLSEEHKKEADDQQRGGILIACCCLLGTRATRYAER